MNACFLVSTLGLGHATRSLPVIRRFAATGGDIVVVSHGNALGFLRMELSDIPGIRFYDMPDYPPIERGRGLAFYGYLLKDIVSIELIRRRETKFVEKVVKRHGIDIVISDGRYGGRSSTCPSLLVTHQVGFAMPGLLKPFRMLSDLYNLFVFKTFDAILIPDYADPEHNLGGELSHNPLLRFVEHHYVGILSSYPTLRREEDIDWLFVISGYLTEHKGSFIEGLMDEAKKLPGQKVFALGNTAENERRTLPDGTLVLDHIAGGEKNDLYNRARTIVARAGYTTIMDLVELGKRAILFPTPNQTEQEYLAKTCGGKGYFPVGSGVADLSSLAETPCTPFDPPWRTEASVELVEMIAGEHAEKTFFSIVIPAHNESACIERTLSAAAELDYPADRYEVIVVENGSTDDTRDRAERFAGGNIRVVSHSVTGVSAARNRGLSMVFEASEWTVFADADTLLAPSFLAELNRAVRRKPKAAVGTSVIRPLDDDSAKARLWFRFYDIGHAVTKTSYSMFFAKTAVARRVMFDERLNYAEDVKFIRQCRKRGAFLFMRTGAVATSPRRFDRTGYVRLLLTWLVQSLTPDALRRGRKYGVVR